MKESRQADNNFDTQRDDHTRICVLGAGRWGMNHIRTLSRLGHLAGIVESDDEKSAVLTDEFPTVDIFGNVRDALHRGYDGFVVATPAETHFELAQFIMDAGYHVLVEKPLTLTSAQARVLKRLAEEKGVNLMVGHILLFHPAVRKMKELIESGKIGRLQYMYSNRLNLGTVRTEENILWSFAPHDISLFQYFTESFPEEVISRGGVFLQPAVHDSSMTVLTYPGNRVGHIFVSWLHPFKEHRIVVIGSKGMLSYEDSSEEKDILYYEKGIDWIQGEPVKHDGATEVIDYERTMPLDEELRYFIDHLDGTPVTMADAQNGVDVLEILEQATRSLLRESAPQVPETRPKGHRDEVFFVHESAVIDDDVAIGEGTKVWHFSHVLSGSRIGAECTIGQNVVIGPDVAIGKGCKIQNNVSVYKGVTLEDNVFCGPSMVFTNVYNPRSEIRRMHELRPTLVKKGTTIGANATIVCGVTIGQYAFIGAGSVVTKDVPDHALVMGNPAEQRGWVCRCGEKLTDTMECPSCDAKYGLNGSQLYSRVE